MATANLTNFSAIINKQQADQGVLADHLQTILELMAFTLSSDLTDFKPAELHAQLMSIHNLLEQAHAQNERMRHRLEAALAF